MDLRCKVLRAASPGELESAINGFLTAVDDEIDVQLEEITQSEGPHGITVTIWYTLLDEQDDEDEVTSGPTLVAPEGDRFS